MWGRWNSQSHLIGKVIEFNWRVFFVDGGIWVVPPDGRQMTEISLWWGGIWIVSKKGMGSEGEEN